MNTGIENLTVDYNQKLKTNARLLRKKATDAELLLWYRIRRKRLVGIACVFTQQLCIGIAFLKEASNQNPPALQQQQGGPLF